MRIPTRLLVLPLLVVYPERAVHSAPVQPALTAARATADSMSVSVRWNRLVPGFIDEATASRRAARKAAAAAGDSAALRRIMQTPPPILFRVYTLLSVAPYGAVNCPPPAAPAPPRYQRGGHPPVGGRPGRLRPRPAPQPRGPASCSPHRRYSFASTPCLASRNTGR